MTQPLHWRNKLGIRAVIALVPVSLAIAIQTGTAGGLGSRNLQTDATATATQVPSGSVFITVTTTEPQINVRAGPSAAVYPVVGILLNGASAPALGRSVGGDWIQIEFAQAPGGKGWVYSPLVTVSAGVLPIAEPPPTPIPPATATIDPTLAAQFNAVPTATRLPTFTPAPPILRTEFTAAASDGSRPPIALGTVILLLGGLGAAGLLVSVVGRG